MEKFVPLTLTEIKKNPAHRTVRIYADGAYDLFHFGHMEQLKFIKTSFENVHLIVGVVTDEDCVHFMGGPAVMSNEERVRTVSLFPFVDEVIADPPFYPTLQFAEEHKIDIVAHDGLPYEITSTNEETSDCYAPFKKLDRFLETQRTANISTTEIMDRVVEIVEFMKTQKQTLE